MSTQKTRQKRAKQADNDESELFASSNEGRTLPDEIVREILIQSPGLIIPYELFIKNDGVSPFADTSHVSSSLISVVCKQWLRVATPLLYHTIIVRSKAQGQALERAIRANEDFAKFIKRIRIEIAYGPPMRTILRLATNITDLFITLNVFSSDNPEGLINALPLLRPTTLILHDSGDSFMNKSATAFQNKIDECIINHWKTLAQVYLPSQDMYWARSRLNDLGASLELAPSLHTIHIDDPSTLNLAFWNRVSRSKSLKVIHAKPQKHSHVAATGDAWKLIRIGGKGLDELADPNLAVSIGLACSRFDDKIWKRILQFSMDIDIPLEKITLSDSKHMLTDRQNWYSRVVCVCKRFHRLGIQYLYRFPHLYGHSLYSFSEHVRKNLTLASHIKLLVLLDPFSPVYMPEQEKRRDENIQEFMKNVHVTAVGTCSPIRQFGRSTMSWAAFEALCQSSSETLTHLHPVHASPPSLDSVLTVFTSLRNVRYLRWRSNVVSGSNFNRSNVPATCFPLLEHLEYEEDSNTKSKRTLLAAMSHMGLPSLRSFRLTMRKRGQGPDTTSFLSAHGSKITTLAIPFVCSASPLKSCPNLITLIDASRELKWKGQDKAFFPAHTSLKKIIYELELSAVKNRNTDIHFSKYICSDLTSLEEIQVQNLNFGSFWPTTDRELESGRNVWPSRAMALSEANIRLTDCHGKHWTPRLERKRKRRG